MYRYFKPLLFCLPPETGHHLAIRMLKWFPKVGGGMRLPKDMYPTLSQQIWGLNFKNPVGLAAGFDKNAVLIRPLLKQGFGFIEVGTVTPLAQKGNPRPRLFRLEEDQAIINRMGFNNKGVGPFIGHLRTVPHKGVVGANIGKNKTQDDPVADYLFLLEELYGKSDYITVNISSPNTPGLRALQAKEALDDLLGALQEKRQELYAQQHVRVPLLLKIAPDVSEQEQEDIAALVLEHRVDGIIIGNTTINLRESLTNSQRNQQGGLSGKPLFQLSTDVLRSMYRLTKGTVPLVGAGGISSGAEAYEKILAGASLVQLYSALIYHGFGIVPQIVQELAELLVRDGFSHISEAIGKKAI